MPRYMPHMLSRSRLNRRLHRLTDLFVMLFDLLARLLPFCQVADCQKGVEDGGL
jgi:hypothetical protein